MRVAGRAAGERQLVGSGLVIAVAAFGVGFVPAVSRGPGVALVANALAAATVGAVVLGSPAAFRAVLVADLVGACVLSGFFGLWPLLAAIGLIGAGLVAAREPRLHLAAPWLSRGSWTRGVVGLLAVTVVGSAGALIAWTLLGDPQVPGAYMEMARRHRPWVVVPLGCAFVLVNAAVEETLFRGEFLVELAVVWGPAAAVTVQAAAFGLLHLLVGFPSGWLGAVMAGVWGVLLGIMRLRSGGMLAPYIGHVCADAIIVSLVVVVLL